MRLFPPVEHISSENVVSVNGVGDTFLGVLVAGLAKENPKDMAQLINIAQKGSVLTMKSAEAVNPAVSTLTKEL